MMFCTNCGGSMAESGKFCEQCGTRIENTSPPESFSHNPGYAGRQADCSGNMQNTAYINNAYINNAPTVPRKYSHSLTLALIAVGLLVFSWISAAVFFVVIASLYHPIGALAYAILIAGAFGVISFILSILALIIGAVHLTKRSCAVGGLILGILLILFYIPYLYGIITLLFV